MGGGDTKLTTQTKQLKAVEREKKHDKIFKEIFQDKEELRRFLSRYIGVEVESSNLEQCNTNFITPKYEYKNADIVYKEKNKEVYYLIEQQTKVDYDMPYRMLKYDVEIMDSARRGKETNRKDYENPLVVLIVLYTGNQKWTAKRRLTDTQTKKQVKGSKTEIEYILIDINEYSIEELLKEGTKVSIALILEKSKKSEQVMDNVQKLLDNKKQLEYLEKLAKYMYKDLDNEEINRIIERIVKANSEGGKEKMSTLRERLKAEYVGEYNKGVRVGISQGISRGISQGINQGISQTLVETIKKLIQENMSNQFIKRITGYEEEEIEKIRKETREKQREELKMLEK